MDINHISRKNNGFTYKDGVSLKEYFDVKLEAVELGIQVAKIDMERRLASINEFRSQLEKQASTFITRTEHDFLVEKINEIRSSVEKRPSWMMTGVFLIISFLLGLLATHYLT